MPEMSVVRFNESDVIVASAVPNSFSVKYFNNGEKNDGVIITGNTTYGYPASGASGISNIFESPFYGSGRDIMTREDHLGHTALDYLISNEGSTGWTADGAMDGYYEYNSRTNAYDWIRQQ